MLFIINIPLNIFSKQLNVIKFVKSITVFSTSKICILYTIKNKMILYAKAKTIIFIIGFLVKRNINTKTKNNSKNKYNIIKENSSNIYFSNIINK